MTRRERNLVILFFSILGLGLLAGGLFICRAPSSAMADKPLHPDFKKYRNGLLPDFSDGTVGQLGPFLWARALDLGEDAHFADTHGRADSEGSYLWTHQFSNLSDRSKTKLPQLNHGRNNFTGLDSKTAYRVQPSHFTLNCPNPHNSKIIFGYMNPDWQFTNGDNCDLAHLAGEGRVCVFLPVERFRGGNVADQGSYRINTTYAKQAICVIEFGPGEIIHYEWFRNPAKLDKHVLFDLAPYFDEEDTNYPGKSRPIFQFDIGEKGSWTLKIERDGTDGLAGGENDGDWDLIFSDKSPGAKPYTVEVDPKRARWNLSTFSPGGNPEETSQILIGLQPYDRTTGKDTEWADRSVRVRSAQPEKLARD
ncbi:MAG: hypothetical protein ACLFUJ_07910 [Phycisphaerae bacterium]